MRGASAPLLLALTTAPAAAPLAVAFGSAVIAAVLLRRAVVSTRPARPAPGDPGRPAPMADGQLEPPAVVAVLTNGYEVPPAAVTATAVDLVRRGWLRLATADGELIVFTNGEGRAGDVLRGFEQQVLNHLVAGSFDGVLSAGTIESAQYRLTSSWWRRFTRDVARTTSSMALAVPRFTPSLLAPAAASVVVGLGSLVVSWRAGDREAAVTESLRGRALWVVGLVVLVGLGWHTWSRWRSHAMVPTDAGRQRASAWMGYRARLRDRIPEHAGMIATPEQQLALAHAFVMGLVPHLSQQFPVAPEDHRHAWSDAGGTPHVLRVHYPFRPGYGRAPWMVAAAGAVTMTVAVVARRFFRRVADGETLTSVVDNFPEQVDLVQRVANGLSWIVIVPMVWAAWAVIAGVVDSVWTIERVGSVVRVRRPIDVVPAPRLLGGLAERDRFAVFLAIDDGRRRSVRAWLANERSAAPQGAVARVRATPLLGYVRSSEPVGASTARGAHGRSVA